MHNPKFSASEFKTSVEWILSRWLGLFDPKSELRKAFRKVRTLDIIRNHAIIHVPETTYSCKQQMKGHSRYAFV